MTFTVLLDLETHAVLEIVSLSSGTLMLVCWTYLSWAKGYVVLASVGRETLCFG